MLFIKIADSNIYDFTVLAIMHSVFTFNLNNEIDETGKLRLVYYRVPKLLLLFELKLYKFKNNKLDNALVILEMEAKSLLIIFSLQLTPSVHTTDGFYIMLINSLEFYFATSKNLSNINYICWYIYIIIKLEKKYGFSISFYQLDILSLPVFVSTAINKIIYYYFCFPLRKADNFYQKRIKQKIAWLDIIIS